MHIPKPFKQHDLKQLQSIIHDYPFGNLIIHSEQGLEAHHLPMLLTHKSAHASQAEQQWVLQSHIARANPLWKLAQQPLDALVIFNGPQCYVSPNYYPSKLENGRAVPTWNYVAVHVKGQIKVIHDSQWLLRFVDDLSRVHEQHQQNPWSIKDAPPGYIDKMLGAIVGLEIDIQSIEGQWKLSQNHSHENQSGVIHGLLQQESEPHHKIAQLMQELQNAR